MDRNWSGEVGCWARIKLEKLHSFRVVGFERGSRKVVIEGIEVPYLSNIPETKRKKSCPIKEVVIIGVFNMIPICVPIEGMEHTNREDTVTSIVANKLFPERVGLRAAEKKGEGYPLSGNCSGYRQVEWRDLYKQECYW